MTLYGYARVPVREPEDKDLDLQVERLPSGQHLSRGDQRGKERPWRAAGSRCRRRHPGRQFFGGTVLLVNRGNGKGAEGLITSKADRHLGIWAVDCLSVRLLTGVMT